MAISHKEADGWSHSPLPSKVHTTARLYFCKQTVKELTLKKLGSKAFSHNKLKPPLSLNRLSSSAISCALGVHVAKAALTKAVTVVRPPWCYSHSHVCPAINYAFKWNHAFKTSWHCIVERERKQEGWTATSGNANVVQKVCVCFLKLPVSLPPQSLSQHCSPYGPVTGVSPPAPAASLSSWATRSARGSKVDL